MPFRNLTNDTTWNVWQDGIKDNMITYFSNYPDNLEVRQIETIDALFQGKGITNYASITPSVLRRISKKLSVNVLITGIIQQAGETKRLSAQLYKTKTAVIFKSFEIDGPAEVEKIFQITDSLRKMVTNFLIISVMEKEIVTDFRPLISTKYPEAYKYYWYGNQAFYDKSRDFSTAKDYYLKAIEIDTNFTEAMRMLVYSYDKLGLPEIAKEWSVRLYRKRDQLLPLQKLYVNAIHTAYFGEILATINCWKSIIEYDDQMPVAYGNLAFYYIQLQQYDKQST